MRAAHPKRKKMLLLSQLHTNSILNRLYFLLACCFVVERECKKKNPCVFVGEWKGDFLESAKKKTFSHSLSLFFKTLDNNKKKCSHLVLFPFMKKLKLIKRGNRKISNTTEKKKEWKRCPVGGAWVILLCRLEVFVF